MIYKKIIILIVVILFVSCGGASASSTTTTNKLEKKSNSNSNICLQYLSAADVNRTNGLYQDCVDAYNIALNEGCGDKYAQQIYQWMGRSYIQLGKIDSASWSVKKGLRVLPDDLQLLNVAAFISNKKNESDDQLYYLDKKLQLEEEIQSLIKIVNNDKSYDDIIELQKSLGMPSDYIDGQWNSYMEQYISVFKKGREDTYKQLNDYYKKLELYDDQIMILDDWYAFNPDNSNIYKEKKTAYINLGKDEIDIDKERWKKDPSNIKFGLEYVKRLKEQSDSEKIVDICLNLMDYSPDNVSVLENLAQAYLDLYEQEKALNTYNKLININNTNIDYTIEISKIYLDLGEYSNSIKFANNAVKSESSVAYYNRAQIYIGIVESCSDPQQLSMSDKAVYEMAWEDLKIAIQKGYRKAKKQADFLQRNYITQNSDWHMNVDDGKSKYSPMDQCYSIIDRTITKRGF